MGIENRHGRRLPAMGTVYRRWGRWCACVVPAALATGLAFVVVYRSLGGGGGEGGGDPVVGAGGGPRDGRRRGGRNRVLEHLRGLASHDALPVATMLLGLLPLTFIVLKLAVVSNEPAPWRDYGLNPWRFTASEVLAAGLFRGLDDNSFWIVVGFWLAAWRIRAAWDLARSASHENALWWRVTRLALIAAIGTYAARWYVGNVEWFGGTYFWFPVEHRAYSDVEFARVKALNHVEGHLFSAGLMLASVFLVIALETGYRVRRLFDVGQVHPAKAAARLLAQGCVMPVLAGFLFQTAARLLVDTLEVSQYGRSATAPVRAFGTIAIYSLPFLVVLGITQVLWRGRLRVSWPFLHRTTDWILVDVNPRSPHDAR